MQHSAREPKACGWHDAASSLQSCNRSAVTARDARIVELERELEAVRERAAHRQGQLQRSCAAKVDQLRALHDREMARLREELAQLQRRQAGGMQEPAAGSCSAAAVPAAGGAQVADADAAAAISIVAVMEGHLARISAALRGREAEIDALRRALAGPQQREGVGG
jgi:hypothetical protein